MLAGDGGHIVNISSLGGIRPWSHHAHYCASKAGLQSLVRVAALELAEAGIRVNAVSPGTVDNDFHAQFSTRQILDAAVAATPAGTLGTNEEIADTILFLCSHSARYIHGQTIEINGGMFMV